MRLLVTLAFFPFLILGAPLSDADILAREQLYAQLLDDSHNVTLLERQTTDNRVIFAPGQFSALTGPDPFVITKGGECSYIFDPAVCWIRIYCYGHIVQTIGAANAQDCTAPNYGRLVFQEGGNFYITRNDDPYQILWQTNTATVPGDELVFSYGIMPYIYILRPNIAYLWTSGVLPQNPGGSPCYYTTPLVNCF
ncbi:MAG: hypothetical protein MMC23_006819 [Stictis urceolatum]|nr:hypothetical protein [Stictis urceolata]